MGIQELTLTQQIALAGGASYEAVVAMGDGIDPRLTAPVHARAQQQEQDSVEVGHATRESQEGQYAHF